MPEFQTEKLLDQLAEDTRKLVEVVQQEFRPLTNDALNQQPGPARWSVAQCLAHLNSYGQYYLPALEMAFADENRRQIPASPRFRSSWFGNYFANSMRPKTDGSIGLKMKAVQAHRPADVLPSETVLRMFLEQQQALLDLLEQARQVNIQQLTVPISIARWLRLSVGDTFRFLIAHQQRHVLQAQRVVAALNLQPVIAVQS
ncbi:DinB family protein [Larkinella bovis]|uniref:DinB family protein n=1 Tax=Larkinella bovis TaxID=683041 RepID=A0ABW0I831_9BACT